MRAHERQHLKRNEFAIRVARFTEIIATYRDRVILGAVVVAVVAPLDAAGSPWEQAASGARASPAATTGPHRRHHRRRAVGVGCSGVVTAPP